MASNLPIVPNTHAHAVSAHPAVAPTLHPGGKIPCPHFEQTPYSRSNSTSCPPRVGNFRFFFPFFSNFVPQFGHTPTPAPSQSACVLLIAASDNIRTRNTAKRLSTSPSISRNVALGCCCLHSAIPLIISALSPFQRFSISALFMLSPFLSPYLTPSPKFYDTPSRTSL